MGWKDGQFHPILSSRCIHMLFVFWNLGHELIKQEEKNSNQRKCPSPHWLHFVNYFACFHPKLQRHDRTTAAVDSNRQKKPNETKPNETTEATTKRPF